MKKYIAFLVALLAVSLVSVSCKKDSDSDYTQSLNSANKLKGEAFLAANRTVDGINETYTGLQYSIDSLGTGIKPDANDSVSITYVAMLIDGTIFESETRDFEMESLIKGMKEGLQLMPEGSVFHLYIPYYLAYNNESRSKYVESTGKLVSISAYSALHYYIKLNKVTPVDDAPEL